MFMLRMIYISGYNLFYLNFSRFVLIYILFIGYGLLPLNNLY